MEESERRPDSPRNIDSQRFAKLENEVFELRGALAQIFEFMKANSGPSQTPVKEPFIFMKSASPPTSPDTKQKQVDDFVQLSDPLAAMGQTPAPTGKSLKFASPEASVPKKKFADDSSSDEEVPLVTSRRSGDSTRSSRNPGGNLDDDPSSSDDDKPSVPTDPHRRKSFHEKLSEAADSASIVVRYAQAPPDYSHIKLQSTLPISVLHFVDQIFEYQLAHRIHLPVPTLISRKVRNVLIARYPKLTQEKFYTLTTKKIVKYLFKEARPTSRIEFVSNLKQYVTFDINANAHGHTLNFRHFHSALLVLRQQYLRVYELMADDNETCVPPCKNKEDCLIKIFCDKIPFKYGHAVYRSLKTDKFENIYKFFAAFFKVIDEHYELYLQFLTLVQFFDGVHNLIGYHGNNNNHGGNNHGGGAGGNDHGGRGRHALHNISEDTQQDDNKDKEEVQEIDPPQVIDVHHDTDDDEDPPSNISAPKVAEVDNEEDLPFGSIVKSPSTHSSTREYEELFDAELNAINAFGSKPHPSNAKDRKSIGCPKLLLYKKCPRGNQCEYSHEDGAMIRSHAYYSKLLNDSPYAPGKKTVNKLPPSKTHDKFLQKKDVLTKNSTASINMIDFSSFKPNEIQYHSPMSKLTGNMLLAAMPETTFYTPMHREGIVEVSHSVHVPIEKALFDTGALYGSYVSRAFIDKYIDVLGPLVTQCGETIVRLADNKTFVKIDSVARLPVCFIGDDEVEHRGIVSFSVLETCASDIIVGLPAIASRFSVLTKQMIDSAVSSHHRNMSLARGNLQEIAMLMNSTQYPWSKPLDQEAPEDIATELPCSFPEALHYMEMTYNEAVKEFVDLIPAHVHPDFAAATHIVNLLETKGKLAFVPRNWEGINGIPLFEVTIKPGVPDSMKPRARAINPRLYEHAKKEFFRLLTYFYLYSNSPIASCLVIAPKATPPYIRFCGDYVAINKFIETGHYPIPHVLHSLEKIVKFKIFLDFDLANAFHQIRLGPTTSALLSVQTPWGQVQPVFMPEGIGPASGKLQQVVSSIFEDFEEWTIVIFDNLLVLAHDYEDAYKKCEIIIDRCIERNVYLKFSKTWLGFPEAKFFGYICKHKSYELSQERKDAIKAIPFPTNKKKMQSFLGCALFFKSFLPHYSTLTAPLNDMVKNDFNWDDKTWKKDYRAIFEKFKDTLQEATAIFYPDYSLDWILRTDASKLGVGAVLFQVFRATPDSPPVFQPIGFASQKFSVQAMAWSTIEQEAYAIYFGVKTFAYYLLCKPFILETDHNNLLWIEASAVPKVIRWRIYLQSFKFLLRHISGKQNMLADWLSRMLGDDEVSAEDTTLAMLCLILLQFDDDDFEDIDVSDILSPMDEEPPEDILEQPDQPRANAVVKPEDILKLVHGGRMGHFGARKTYNLLAEFFPGHRIPYRVVAEFVAMCPICQKDRLGMTDNIQPIIRHLKPLHRRSIVGVDTLKVTPPDKAGNCLITVITNHFTKFTGLYPGKQPDAITAATALFQFFCTYGLCDSIISDPGSEFMNEVVKHLTTWLGIRHQFSLVDRHESNGVEGTNKQILRHLKALVMDERIADKWSDPTVLPLIQFMINSTDSSETGVIPLHAHFGTADATYLKMPEEGGNDMHRLHRFVQLLDANLHTLQDISRKHQLEIVNERTSATPAESQNQYQQGDYVLFQLDPNEPLPTKLTPKFKGPYEVVKQESNNVTCKHLVLGHQKIFHVTRLKIFHGTRDEAITAARIDNDQFVIREFRSYRGNPLIRTTVEFEVVFEDESIEWLVWCKDLFDTTHYEDFCRSRHELYPLLYSADHAKRELSALNKSPIVEVAPGDVVYVNLRSYGATWYKSLPLPDLFHRDYVLRYEYGRFIGRQLRKIIAECPLFNETFNVDHQFVFLWGRQHEFNPEKHLLIDEAFVAQYPMILPNADQPVQQHEEEN